MFNADLILPSQLPPPAPSNNNNNINNSVSAVFARELDAGQVGYHPIVVALPTVNVNAVKVVLTPFEGDSFISGVVFDRVTISNDDN